MPFEAPAMRFGPRLVPSRARRPAWRIYSAALRDQVHYTFSPGRPPYPDLGKTKQVRSIAAGDRCSVVVRRHQSFDMAHAYLIGLKDGDQSE